MLPELREQQPNQRIVHIFHRAPDHHDQWDLTRWRTGVVAAQEDFSSPGSWDDLDGVTANVTSFLLSRGTTLDEMAGVLPEHVIMRSDKPKRESGFRALFPRNRKKKNYELDQWDIAQRISLPLPNEFEALQILSNFLGMPVESHLLKAYESADSWEDSKVFYPNEA